LDGVPSQDKTKQSLSLSNTSIVVATVTIVAIDVIVSSPPIDNAISEIKREANAGRIACIADRAEKQVTAKRLCTNSRKPTSAWLRCILRLWELA
jgi:hypothetical protein